MEYMLILLLILTYHSPAGVIGMKKEEEQNERISTASEILRSSTIIFRGKICVFKISNFMYPRHHHHQDKQMHVVVISLRHMSS